MFWTSTEMTTKEIKELVGITITAAQEDEQKGLPESQRLKIVYPVEINEYLPKHGIGEFLVFLNSIRYDKSKNSGSVVQDKDIIISVVTAVRILEKGKTPEEYVDFLEAALSGKMILSNRPDKMIYPVSVTFLKEESNYWWYQSNFVCPSTNMQGMKQ
jgi:hypothetical protein